MDSAWPNALVGSFEDALELLAGAVRDCNDETWEMPMWRVSEPDGPFPGADWKPIIDPAQVRALAQNWVQRRSTPWSVAWHALEVLDYDLNGESGQWTPPPPFSGHPHWRDLPTLPAPWSRSEILAYIDYCGEQVRHKMALMTDEEAAVLLPQAHRYGGQPHARIITGLIVHTTEHAAQIRQFLTSAGIVRGS